jgi:hypothetical protein
MPCKKLRIGQRLPAANALTALATGAETVMNLVGTNSGATTPHSLTTHHVLFRLVTDAGVGAASSFGIGYRIRPAWLGT